MLRELLLRSSLIFFTILLTSCSSLNQDLTKIKNNKEEHRKSPYVLLISLDGFRHDYIDLHDAKNLKKFRSEGLAAKGLRPMFPTKTFPNHLSIVTGLRPDNHGIVANHFYSPDLKKEYSLRDRSAVEDGRFYTSIPIWSLAEKNGMNSATYFWPGSEAKVAGERPTLWKKYNHGTPHNERIDTVVKWLSLSKEKRPHLVTLYFHDVDSAGHKYGPKAKQTYDAVQKVDNSLGKLFNKLKKLNLPLNIIIVSDHGMTEIHKDKVEYFETNLSKKELSLYEKFRVIGYGPVSHFYYQGSKEDKDRDTKKLAMILNKNARNYKVYKRNQIPKKFNFSKNPRIGDLLAIAKNHWTIGRTGKVKVLGGNHGYDPYDGSDMNGILLLKGPNIKRNKKIGVIDNIDLYPFMSDLLRLQYQHGIDGSRKSLAPLLK